MNENFFALSFNDGSPINSTLPSLELAPCRRSWQWGFARIVDSISSGTGSDGKANSNIHPNQYVDANLIWLLVRYMQYAICYILLDIFCRTICHVSSFTLWIWSSLGLVSLTSQGNQCLLKEPAILSMSPKRNDQLVQQHTPSPSILIRNDTFNDDLTFFWSLKLLYPGHIQCPAPEFKKIIPPIYPSSHEIPSSIC